MTTLVIRGPASIDGDITVPGDKSISHRALMIAAIAEGRSVIRGLGPGDDVSATRRCLEAYGVPFVDDDDRVVVEGCGSAGWRPPEGPLDCANSGTTMRLLAGLATRHDFESTLDGDASLRRRPMDRIARPLRQLGAHVVATDDRYAPLVVKGGNLKGTTIEVEVPSAQVKSCVILAALGAEGPTVVRVPGFTRDHTERLLRALGARIDGDDPRLEVAPFDPPAFSIDIPGDASSAAFLVAAALLRGRVRIEGVSLNPTRIAFLHACARMGSNVRWEVGETRLGEDVGRVDAGGSSLHGIGIEGPLVPLMIDELPLIAVLGSVAVGTTVVAGASELRVKESDRIAAMVAGLRAMGADIAERPDGFEVNGPNELVGATVDSRGDHRIAMALAVAGLAAQGETRIEGFDSASVSWPGFERVLAELGADVELS